MQGKNCSLSITNWNRVKLLGQGSYGVVFLAVPITGPPRFVALKVALMDHSSSLMMEKNILQNFGGCPEIVQCIGSDTSFEGDSFDSIFYNLVLEYGSGGTLADLIMGHKLSESEVKEYLKMILRGLSCIHDRGFVHCDLKPTNILVFPKDDGNVQLKIADFGLSKRYDECEEVECFEPKFRGTPKYMSPESVLGRINTGLDIWSLGCILIEMVSGKSAWDDCENQEQVMKKLVYEMEIPDIPEELSSEGRDFLARCLDQDFERRWTASMLLEHPYLKEEKVDEMCLIWNLPNSIEELFKEKKYFFGSCFEVNSPSLYFNEGRETTNNGDEMSLTLSKDDPIFEIANLIGFHDFVL